MPVFVSPTSGTRTEPTDSLIFTRGTIATFKTTFTNNGIPTVVDTGTEPLMRIRQPRFIQNIGTPFTASNGDNNVIFQTTGALVANQQFEYEFQWNIPSNIVPSDEYAAVYVARIGGILLEYGSELFTIASGPGVVNTKPHFYATVDDIRAHKFNIDDYLPKAIAKDLNARNQLIQTHIRFATEKLQEELNLTQSRSNSYAYRIFTVMYSIYSILLASRGEDGSSVSDQNLNFYRSEWKAILEQEKREGVLQGLPLGRG
jgi:hypothetical protein